MFGNCPYCFGITDTGGKCWNSECPKKNWEHLYPPYPTIPSTYPTGWICPKCGAGLSPTTSKCDCHITYTTGTSLS